MTETLTVECDVHFYRRGRGSRRELRPGGEPPRPATPGRVPRIARLMALALRFDSLLRAGEIAHHTELARLGHVTRARVSQILNLLNLARDIRQAILFLPRTVRGRAPIILRDLQPIAAILDWHEQRRWWQQLRATTACPGALLSDCALPHRNGEQWSDSLADVPRGVAASVLAPHPSVTLRCRALRPSCCHGSRPGVLLPVARLATHRAWARRSCPASTLT